MSGIIQSGVICDPHPLWLDAVEHVLGRLGVTTVGKTTCPVEALTLVEQQRPELLVTELEASNGEFGGLELLERALSTVANLRSIVLSTRDDPGSIESALAAGAAGYVVKIAHPDDLAFAVRQTFAPSVYMAARPGLAAVSASPGVSWDEDPGLTRREREILQLVAEGHSNAQLARMLWVTEQTIKFHLSNIYRKLDVANRTEASRWAQVHGLLDRSAPPAPALLTVA